MKITKFGQCCLLVEVSGKRILTDPGRFTTSQNDLANIDIILLTHEHADHLHTGSLRAVLENSPAAVVYCNTSVGSILSKEEIPFVILEGRDMLEAQGIRLEAYDGKHEEIFESYGQVQNTGYFIAEQLFYPGDAYIEPEKPVLVLALPIAGPWCKAADAIHYALKVKPVNAFPVHDWLLNADGESLVQGLFESQLKERKINFVRLGNGESVSFK